MSLYRFKLTLAVSLAAFIVWKSICDDNSVAAMLPSSCVPPHVISFDCSFNSCDCETYGLLSILHLIAANNKKVGFSHCSTTQIHRRSISSLPSFIAGKWKEKHKKNDYSFFTNQWTIGKKKDCHSLMPLSFSTNHSLNFSQSFVTFVPYILPHINQFQLELHDQTDCVKNISNYIDSMCVFFPNNSIDIRMKTVLA